MRLAITGPALSGKTTLFNALTGVDAAVGAGSERGLHIGVFQVPDPALDRLAGLLEIPRVTRVHVEMVDVPALASGDRGRGIDDQVLHQARLADALVVVVRAFADPSVPHPSGRVDAPADLDAAWADMVIADLVSTERRLERLRPLHAKGGTTAEEKVELAALERIADDLSGGRGVRDAGLSAEEERLLRGYGFLTAKPLLVVFNVGEEDLPAEPAPEWVEAADRLGAPALAVGVGIAAELARMDAGDAADLAEAYGCSPDDLVGVIQAAYGVLDVVTFYTTVGEREARAWTLPRGGSVVQAAGVVHSDMERGFIRAEVVGVGDLLEAGSMAEARNSGLIHQEGRTYLVQDGDVIHIKFAV